MTGRTLTDWSVLPLKSALDADKRANSYVLRSQFARNRIYRTIDPKMQIAIVTINLVNLHSKSLSSFSNDNLFISQWVALWYAWIDSASTTLLFFSQLHLLNYELNAEKLQILVQRVTRNSSVETLRPAGELDGARADQRVTVRHGNSIWHFININMSRIEST